MAKGCAASVLGAPPLSLAAANGDLAQLFYFGKEFFSGLLAQCLAEKHAE